MGTFKWPLRIASMDGQQARDIEAVVDTGAAYSTLPARLLRELGVATIGKRRLLLADGRRIELDYGQAWATIDGESVVTLVVFGEDDAQPCWGPIRWKAYSTLPARLLRELGVADRQTQASAGRRTRIELDYGQAWATIDGESVVTLVVFGEDDAQPCWGPIRWKVWLWRWIRWNSDWSQLTSSCTSTISRWF